jgi:serine/threonine protein kinase
MDTLGKGVFGNVVKVLNIETEKEYAVKILRNNEMIMKSGEKESGYLKKINSDYVIRCHETFVHRSHYCIVFELLGSDIRARIS